MSPTVCMTDVPILVADAPCRRNKCRMDRNKIAKHPRLELRCIPSLSTSAHLVRSDRLTCSRWKADSSAESISLSANDPKNESWEFIAKRRRLLNIAVRTIALMHRNRILQKNLDALRFETTHFLQSVLHNQGNRDKTEKSKINEKQERGDFAQSFPNDIRATTSTSQIPTFLFADSDSSLSSEPFASGPLDS